ncbi:cyclin-like protein [Athelia psychrophila]|uniref:Cyclin-like protein n=1 Tax=Athelia psychrophila TaxID=1759441 RepID=A0A166AVU7_9AGAM|nr:cyclin-like protein [Fibularhizoctonia sp. CBS 109695]
MAGTLSSAASPAGPSQWIFSASSLLKTPSNTASGITLDKELYDRSRGVEFLFRLGSSLGLPSTAMFTAATWFHRFFMRYSLDNYHRQDVAASCIFLATKTEECGRKLRDVARVCEAKIANKEVNLIPEDGKEVETRQTSILLVEEVLLEAICFDFVVDSPHAELVDLFDSLEEDMVVKEYAWSIAHDSYRTPLCILQSPRIIAAACYILAQKVAEGPNSASLDDRVSLSAGSASLPTPPSQQPAPPNSSHRTLELFALTEWDVGCVADALEILVGFYSVQDGHDLHPHITALQNVPPITTPSTTLKLYHVASNNSTHHEQALPSLNGEQTPDGESIEKHEGKTALGTRLDLS